MTIFKEMIQKIQWLKKKAGQITNPKSRGHCCSEQAPLVEDFPWECKNGHGTKLWCFKLCTRFFKNKTYAYYTIRSFQSQVLTQDKRKQMSLQNLAHKCSEQLHLQWPQNWKQRKIPWNGEWINKLWSTHTMEYYLVMKRKELLIHTAIWYVSE